MARFHEHSQSSDYVESGVTHEATHAIAAWVKLKSFGGYLSSQLTNANSHSVRIRATAPSSDVAVIVSGITNWTYISNTGFVPLNVWRCIAYTFDQSAGALNAIHIYVGSLAAPFAEVTYASRTDGGTIDTGSGHTFQFGNENNFTGTAPLAGAMSSASMWERTLTLRALNRWRDLTLPNGPGIEAIRSAEPLLAVGLLGAWRAAGQGFNRVWDWSGQGHHLGSNKMQAAGDPFRPTYHTDRSWLSRVAPGGVQITDVDPSTFSHGQSGIVITGTGF